MMCVMGYVSGGRETGSCKVCKKNRVESIFLPTFFLDRYTCMNEGGNINKAF